MKKSIILRIAIPLLFVLTLTAMALAPVSVTLQNKCAAPVKYEIRTGGAKSGGTVEANGKVKVNIEIGAKIFVDGEEALTVSATDNGTTFVVCR